MSTRDFELVDVPIEFKEINPSDFNSNYIVSEKEMLIPENGFITDSLLQKLQDGLDVKNTVVINAGVGQGKSKAILDMVDKYSSQNEYIVIIAVPFKNLIEQYVEDCLKFTIKSKIFNLINIENETNANNLFSFSGDDPNKVFPINKFKIHILTTNGLLGNSGEDSLFQASLKSTYFKELQEYCTSENKKMIIIFDEIHDSIHNFREELIINLWNYQGLIHKIFTLSATYNEASKEVIKYLSEFTEKKIQIIESKRDINLKSQSRLHIYFYSGMYIERDKQLLEVLQDCLKNPLNLDMMVYSKTLIKTFLSKPNPLSKFKEVNQLLFKNKEIINRCYADIFDKKNANKKYDKNKINIGTNFTTGVNIEKKNHNYIVIFPKEVFIEYFNNKGVFTNGSSTIIQALARQRKKGDIHIFLPYPEKFDENSLPYNKKQMESFLNSINPLCVSSNESIKYSDINAQKDEATSVFNKLFLNTERARNFIENRDTEGMNRILFHPKEIFILNKIEKHLSKTFFGGNLSNYIIWASLCNQFLNCRLVSINYSKRIYLSSKNLEDEISAIYQNEIFELDNFDYSDFDTSIYPDLDILNIKIADNLSDYELYEYFEEYFFKTFEVYVDNVRIIKEDSNKIKLILINLIQNLNQTFDKKQSYHKYLKSNIHFSNQLNFDEVPDGFINKSSLKTIQLYKEWYDFVKLLEVEMEVKKNKKNLPSTTPIEFKKLFISKNMMENIEQLRNSDIFLNSDTFSFNDTFKRITNSNKMAESFYTLLIKVLYNGKRQSTTLKGKPYSKYVLEDIDFENSNLFNLLYNKLPEEIL